MNKKGITLIEVIISVALISLVMVFLFNLLMDMEYEEDHASYAKENQLNRAMIIKRVQEDFQNFELKKVDLSLDKKTITLTFGNNQTKNIYVDRKSINYNNNEKWNIEGNDDTYIDISKISVSSYLPDSRCASLNTLGMNCSAYYSYRIILPVVTGNTENTIDDIEFFYIGRA